MKKFLTLVLALVLVFGLSVPAMAFTSDTSDKEDHPFDLSIYLVEYDDNDLFGVATLPESDRGYAKNEIVAAVIELYVPEDENPMPEYEELQFRGDNVTYDVTDTPIYNDKAAALGTLIDDGEDGWILDFSDKNGNGTSNDPMTFADDTTYKWLVFAKVTDDDASMSAKLIDGVGVTDWTHVNEIPGDPIIPAHEDLTVTLDGEDYLISAYDDFYLIRVQTGDYADAVIKLDIDDDDHETLGMSINPDLHTHTTLRALGVNTDNELGFILNAVVKTDGDEYDDIMDVYQDVVVDVFGLDYFLIGNYLRDSFFEDLVSADTIIATVDIEPWTAYVTVPDNIVVDPPKTGDAASVMGFVMVALSGAGAVALKKRV